MHATATLHCAAGIARSCFTCLGSLLVLVMDSKSSARVLAWKEPGSGGFCEPSKILPWTLGSSPPGNVIPSAPNCEPSWDAACNRIRTCLS